MKNIISVLLIVAFYNSNAQRNREPKMAPVLADGYYVTYRGDTVRGDIQINPKSRADFYKHFAFKKKRSKRLRLFNGRKAKYYGYNEHDFVSMNYHGKQIFVERLAKGKLNLYEYRFEGKIDGYPAIESTYFIQDKSTNEGRTEGPDKISRKFYKRSLKPYMKDEQPALWEDLDKYNFNKRDVIDAIKEFNSKYAPISN